jgi:ABC-type sugar transport system substrate-binding protein
MCKDAGAYWTSVWNIADGDYPMDYNPSWVAHCSPDDTVAGYEIAVALFESFETPGKGKILALEGMLGNTASSNRTAGLKKALEEYPDVELLDMQPTDWDMQISLDITETWLSKYDDFDGIWTSGDPMGLGAITALTKAGLNGKVGVTGVNGTQEAIDAVKAGDMTATWDVNGYMQGYYATAWAVAAKLGVIDPASEPVSDRMFYTPGMLVTSDNVDSAGKAPEMNYKDFKSFNLGEMANEYQG